VPVNAPDCNSVLDRLAKFSDTCGTREAASKRLGIAKGTLTKWFAKRKLSVGSLRMLAAFESDADLAEAARSALVASGIGIACFDFGRIASQLICAGPGASLLFHTLRDNAPLEELEFAAIRDFVAALADCQYYETMAEAALDGFKKLPDHPLLNFGVADFERPLFPDDDGEMIGAPAKEIDWDSIDWGKINEPHQRRSEAARAIMRCALHEPKHRLFEEMIRHTASRLKDRDSTTPTLSNQSCLEIAANAAVDVYKMESALIESSNAIRRAVDAERSLESRPLYAVATKVFEMRYPMRPQTVERVLWMKAKLNDDEKFVQKIDGICAFVHQALYSDRGVTFSHFSFAHANVNKHGSVLDYDDGRIIRSVVGKKRLAPKRAIVRVKAATTR
jgi:hypothetical protein